MSGNTVTTAADKTSSPATAPTVPDPRMLSLSNIPDDLLPAFSPVDRAVILVCKIVTGKKTEAQVMEMLNGSKPGSN